MKIEGKAPLGQKVLPERDYKPTQTPTEKDYIDAAGEHLDIAKAQMSWVRVLLEMSREEAKQQQIEKVRLLLQGRKWTHRPSNTKSSKLTKLEKDDTHGY